MSASYYFITLRGTPLRWTRATSAFEAIALLLPGGYIALWPDAQREGYAVERLARDT